MNDDERDARMETLTDAIADAHRAAAEGRRAAADAHRVAADAHRSIAVLSGKVDVMVDTVTENNTVITRRIDTLSEIVHLHLQIDHGYPALPPDRDTNDGGDSGDD